MFHLNEDEGGEKLSREVSRRIVKLDSTSRQKNMEGKFDVKKSQHEVKTELLSADRLTPPPTTLSLLPFSAVKAELQLQGRGGRKTEEKH